MKRTLILVMVLALVLSAGSAYAQQRLSQKEIFVGGAIPLAPDGFKDFHKAGFSMHAQYVMFPMPNIGLSFGAAYEFFLFDDQAYIEDLNEALSVNYTGELTDDLYQTEGSASILELGIGIRPYLTSPTSNFQIFVFGMGTVNIIKSEVTETYDFYVTYTDPYEEVHYVGDSTYTSNATKVGAALGGGIEIPAGQVNIIIQGIARFIPTVRPVKSVLDESWQSFGVPYEDKEEMLSFFGITAGIVF